MAGKDGDWSWPTLLASGRIGMVGSDRDGRMGWVRSDASSIRHVGLALDQNLINGFSVIDIESFAAWNF